MRQSLLLCLLLAACISAEAATSDAHNPFGGPRIAIIIDDLGSNWHEGKEIIDLPGRLTVSIIPYTPFARSLALLAHRDRHEVMLHLPMQAIDDNFLGYGGLTESMSKQKFLKLLHASLQAVPDISGVNNHMGSRLTQDATRMAWVMAGLRQHGDLYFVDSRTTSLSQADNVAREYGLEHARRDVFLDDNMAAQIHKQWHYFLHLAWRKGSAIAIAHPYPKTIAFLKQALPNLAKQGIDLVPVSKLIQWRQTRRSLAWQTQSSSSPLPRVAKSSKP